MLRRAIDLVAPEPVAAAPTPKGAYAAVILPVGIVVAAVSLAIWIATVVTHKSELWYMFDLHVYNFGGQMAHEHPSHLYSGRYHGLPFLYPPFAALIFAKTYSLSLAVLKFVMAIGTLLALFGSIWLTLGLLGHARNRRRVGVTLLAGGVALWLEPVQQTLFFGQVSIMLMVLVLADLALPDRRWYKGILIGFAAGFKVTPLIFIPYLLITRRFRAAATATGAFLVTMAIGFAFLPKEAKQFWTTVLTSPAQRVGWDYVQNQSINGFIVRVPGLDSPARALWFVLAAVVFVVGLAIAAQLHARGETLLGILTAALVMLLVSPISWTHYWSWIVPGFVFAVDRLLSGAVPRLRLATAATVTTFLLFFAWPMQLAADGSWSSDTAFLPMGLVWLMPRNAGLERQWNPFQHFLGNYYLWIGLIALAALAYYARKLADQTVQATGKPDLAVTG